MDELARELASLRGEVVPVWDEARSERLYSGVGRLRRRRRARRRTVGACALLCVAGLAVTRGPALWRALQPQQEEARLSPLRAARSSPLVVQPTAARPARPATADARANAVASEPIGEPLQLADGSRVERRSADAELGVERNERDHIALRLEQGSAHFDVIPNTHRVFTVQAGAVEVAVVGTVFDVERSGGRVRVSVTRGKVRVRSPAGSMLVPAGDALWFDDAEAGRDRDAPQQREVASSAGKSRAPRASRRPVAHEEAPSRPQWRSLSQSGDYEGAYRLLAQGSAVEDDSEALLDAADAARLSGHPEAAAGYLRKVLVAHRESPVAPLAAFTLGRVLLERLGQPTEAAEAFASARELAPQGSLAQDALAREVEAWSKAGHPNEAYEHAQEYVRRYPDGRRLRAVQLYGGLRAP